MKAAPEKYRVKKNLIFATKPEDGNNGVFIIPHDRIANYFFCCIISDGLGWEHVSVSLQSKTRRVERCPTWQEMCTVKDIFWNEDECVVQFHPAKSDYVSNHPYCLHLWKPTNIEMPSPDPTMVGIKEVNIQR